MEDKDLSVAEIIWHKYDSSEWLTQALMQDMVSATENAIKHKGAASWVLSGGSSPKRLYQQLAKVNLPWEKITCLLSDERCLEEGHPQSNSTMLWSLLLKQHPEVNWVPIWDPAQGDLQSILVAGASRLESIAKPFSWVLLGMGPDGHTASLFPNSVESHNALEMDYAEPLVFTQAPQFPQQRISLSLLQLLNADCLNLLIMGQHKKEVLETGLQISQIDFEKSLPIHKLIAVSKQPVHIYWSPT